MAGIEPIYHRGKPQTIMECPLGIEKGTLTINGERVMEMPGLDQFLRQQAERQRHADERRRDE